MIVASHLGKRYPNGFAALDDLGFSIERGELVCLSGPSGAGKSTLIKLLAAIERPTSGSLKVNGQEIGRISRKALPYLRRSFGLVFQDLKLLMDRSLLENVLLPLQITGFPHKEGLRRARMALERVGLLEREQAMPVTLSGGEQQRLAIARAVVNRPSILIADEPTGNLDEASANTIFQLLDAFHQAGVTVLVSTHDRQWIERRRPRLLQLQQGKLL